MGPPSYMRFVVDRNVFVRRILYMWNQTRLCIDGMWEVWRSSWPVAKVRLFLATTRSVTKATFCHSTFAVQSFVWHTAVCWEPADGVWTIMVCHNGSAFPTSVRTFTKVTFRHSRVAAWLSCVYELVFSGIFPSRVSPTLARRFFCSHSANVTHE
jgi:hypothetical protein